jgi:hypothetical protein
MTPLASLSRYGASGPSSGIIHQQLPQQFANVNLATFCKFLSKKALDPQTEVSFEDWRDLLAFLHASPKFSKMLGDLAQVCILPSSILSAFRALKVLCTDASRRASIPRVDANIDFFVAHDMYVEIAKPRDKSLNLYMPEEVLGLLNREYMVLVGSKVVATKRCSRDWHSLTCLEYYPKIDAKVARVCEVLVRHGYLMMRDGNRTLCGIAPNQYDNVAFHHSKNKISLSMSTYDIPHQVCLVSQTEMLCSAQSIYQHQNGIDVKNTSDCVVFPLIFENLPQSQHFKKICDAINKERYAAWCESYPKQINRVCSGVEGWVATTDYSLCGD